MLWAELGAVIARTNFAMLTRYRDRVSGVIGRNPQLSFSLETRAMLAQVEIVMVRMTMNKSVAISRSLESRAAIAGGNCCRLYKLE